MAGPKEIEGMLIRKGIGQLSAARISCSSCNRTPLPGEKLHRFETGRTLCDLCLPQRPAHKPGPISSEQVLVTERSIRITRA
jgi:hypothetical protein